MKKLILALLAVAVAAPLAAQDKTPYSESAVAYAVAESDSAKVKKLLATPVADMTAEQKNHLNHFFIIAAETCQPRATVIHHETSSGTFGSYIPKCNKAQNAKILEWLLSLDQVSNSFVIDVQKNEKNGIYTFDAVTPISRLKTNNPAALRALLPKLDPCTIALTQMQAVQPNDTNYHVYADVWRTNGCSLSKIKRMGQKEDHKIGNDNAWSVGIKPLEKAWTEPESWSDSHKDWMTLVYETGKSRAYLIQTYGNPTFYEAPFDYREIFTYRRVLSQRENDNTYYKVADYIYTLDRGVVTHVQYKVLKDGIHFYALALKTIDLDEFKKKGY